MNQLKNTKMILWIENYSNKADNSGFKVTDINHAALFATASHQYSIKHPCGILTESGKRYKFTLKDDNGTIIATRAEIKKLAQIITSAISTTFAAHTQPKIEYK